MTSEERRATRIRAVSAAMMVAGDRLASGEAPYTGTMSVSDMLTFLNSDTQFEGFTSWMLKGRPNRFSSYDTGSGRLGLADLERAVGDYLDTHADTFIVDYTYIHPHSHDTKSERWKL